MPFDHRFALNTLFGLSGSCSSIVQPVNDFAEVLDLDLGVAEPALLVPDAEAEELHQLAGVVLVRVAADVVLARQVAQHRRVDGDVVDEVAEVRVRVRAEVRVLAGTGRPACAASAATGRRRGRSRSGGARRRPCAPGTGSSCGSCGRPTPAPGRRPRRSGRAVGRRASGPAPFSAGLVLRNQSTSDMTGLFFHFARSASRRPEPRPPEQTVDHRHRQAQDLLLLFLLLSLASSVQPAHVPLPPCRIPDLPLSRATSWPHLERDRGLRSSPSGSPRGRARRGG